MKSSNVTGARISRERRAGAFNRGGEVDNPRSLREQGGRGFASACVPDLSPVGDR
jgi:hypothetical protein